MAETSEVTARDFQKTAVAQNRKIEAIKDRPVGYSGDEPLYRRHEGFGRRVISGKTEAEYKRGEGGHVYTEINSGKANLAQAWGFNQNGELISVRIQRKLNDRDVSMISFKRDPMTDKFQIEESRSSSGPMSSTLEKTWEEEFYTARTKTAANQNEPTGPVIRPAIKLKSLLP